MQRTHPLVKLSNRYLHLSFLAVRDTIRTKLQSPPSQQARNGVSASKIMSAENSITIYALSGSQFAGKVLAALDARKIQHYVQFVSLDPNRRKKELPSGGELVPEMKVVLRKDTEPTIVQDSEAILHWLDDHFDTRFFPNKEASDLSVRASNKIVAGSVWYFNWVDQEGYDASMKMTAVRGIFPWFVPSLVGGFLVDFATKQPRAKYRRLAFDALEVEEDKFEDREHIRNILVEELKYFQSLLKSEDQAYFLGSEPTAPDFSVYAQVERLVGDMGDANVSPATPSFKGDTPELNRFWKWYSGMREKHPIKFKGKRTPKGGISA